jgi:hypothetical protein
MAPNACTSTSLTLPVNIRQELVKLIINPADVTRYGPKLVFLRVPAHNQDGITFGCYINEMVSSSQDSAGGDCASAIDARQQHGAVGAVIAGVA